jgi:hypothetical protein
MKAKALAPLRLYSGSVKALLRLDYTITADALALLRLY